MSSVCYLLLYLSLTLAAFSSEITQQAKRPLRDDLKLPADALAGAVIPGLAQGGVPQGLAFDPATGNLYTSMFFPSGRASVLTAISQSNDLLKASFTVRDTDAHLLTGHFGGIAIGLDRLWLASDASLYEMPLTAFESASNTTVTAIAEHKTEAVRADFCTVYDDQIWVGEFYHKEKYPTPKSHHSSARPESHAWLIAYHPDSFDQPQRILALPDFVQGIYMSDENIVLSRSFGRRKRSKIEIYPNPFESPADLQVPIVNAALTPLWFLSPQKKCINFPPLSENICMIDDRLGVITESAAKKFRWGRRQPTNRIILLNIDELPRP